MPLQINAYCTLNELLPLDFPHELTAQRDLGDPELAEHLRGFVGYVISRGDQDMTATRYHVMRHAQRVRHHLSFSVEEAQKNEVARWAWNSNSILIFPDGSVRDPSGNVLVSSEGKAPDEAAQVPYPEEALQRMVRTNKQLEEQGIPFAEDLPPAIGESEALPRDASEVAQRASALFTIAMRAEALAGKKDLSVTQLKEMRPLSFQYLTPLEKDFLDADSPEEQLIINAAWRYEALYLLLWALQLRDDLPFPSQTCDVPWVGQTLFPLDEQQFIDNATLRPTSELLEQLDLHYRLHWASRNGAQDLSNGVVMERHHALNWLLEFENVGVEWDDVETPT